MFSLLLMLACMHTVLVQLAKEEAVRLWRKIRDLEVEVMETEYNIRQEVCREFQEQIVEIEEAHRWGRHGCEPPRGGGGRRERELFYAVVEYLKA